LPLAAQGRPIHRGNEAACFIGFSGFSGGTFKKGRKSEAGNYRPVSLTSHVCKVLESIIKDSIVEHLNNNELLNETQHGFRSKRSCLTNLLIFMEKVSDYVDQGCPVDVVYLDF
jgi:hypothetical protein